jgi:hypothetical protein
VEVQRTLVRGSAEEKAFQVQQKADGKQTLANVLAALGPSKSISTLTKSRHDWGE